MQVMVSSITEATEVPSCRLVLLLRASSVSVNQFPLSLFWTAHAERCTQVYIPDVGREPVLELLDVRNYGMKALTKYMWN